jgi:uncharacterized tellurite resistance protein B-like protein
MFDTLKSWLLGHDAPGTGGRGRRSYQEHEIAAAALLVEAASLDGTFDANERATVKRLLHDRFRLSDQETEDLLAEGQARNEATEEIFKFTLAARDAFDEAERVGLIEMLWTTVLSDGRVHDYEANLMRRIAGLLHVTDRDSGEARKRAARELARQGSSQGDEE